MYWVSAVLNWVFVKFILGNKTFSYKFFTDPAILIWYSLFLLLFVTPGLKKQLGIQKNNWVNTPKSSLSVSLVVYIYLAIK